MSATTNSADFFKSPFRTFFSLWLPVLFSLIAEPVTGLVDTAFVARLGAGPLAALGVGTMVLSGVFWIFNFLSVGSQTEVSQALGRREMERGTRIASLAMLLALCAGLGLMLLAWFFAAPVASAMGATDAVHRQAMVYIRWRAAGAPAVLLTMTAFGVLYGLQDMRMPLWIAVGVNAMNIVLDWMLIFGLGPLPAMGIAGAAAASAASQWIGAGWAVYRIHRRLGFTRRIQIVDVRRLLKVGAAMLGGRHIVAAILVPSSALALFYPAWTAAALIQPVGALAFVTDGIHWGTGDFRYLRNVVVLATICGAVGIWMLGGGSPDLLTAIWWITGAWIAIRACFGLLRIWPAIGKSPLRA